MARRKKTADNPEPLFRKVLIENSVSDTWEEAIREWEMTGYYNVTDKYKSCIDSAQQIKNLTVITNKLNFKELEICNRCVELYFDITESRKIETAVRRIKTDISFIINKEGLLYLLVNEAISFRELLCYEALMKKRNDPEIIKFKERTNEKLINLTDYSNKQLINDINCILVWVKGQHPTFDLKPVATIWKDIISGGIVDMDALNSIIEDNKITRRFYTKSEIKEARQLLVKYMDDDNIDSHVYSAYLDTVPKTKVEDNFGFETERELPTREEYLRLNNFKKSDPNKICIRGEILDLSCLEEGIVEDYVDEEEEEEFAIKVAEALRELKSKKIKIKSTFYDVGMLLTEFMTDDVNGYKLIDFHGNPFDNVYEIVKFLDIPEITKFLFKQDHKRFFCLSQLTEVCDDEHLGYLLSGFIAKIDPENRIIAIFRINRILSKVDRCLILNEKTEECYQYKVHEIKGNRNC